MAMFFSSLKLKLSSFWQPGTHRAQPCVGMLVYNCQIKTPTSELNSNHMIHVHTEIVVAVETTAASTILGMYWIRPDQIMD